MAAAGDAPRKKGKGGRPTIFSAELADEICRRMSEGETVTAICADADMPNLSTVWRWEQTNAEFCNALARAREARAHVWMEEGIQIADDGTQDMKTVRDKDGREREVFDAEHVQRSRLRVETRMRLAAKHNPKAYGEKAQMEVTGKDGAPIVPEADPKAIARQVAFFLATQAADAEDK